MLRLIAEVWGASGECDMRRPVPDLETWSERSGPLTKANRELLELLRLLAAEAGQPDSDEATVRAYRRIHREIRELIGRKDLAERRARHDKEVKVIWQRQRGNKDWHVILVRSKAYELGIRRARQNQEKARQLALQDFKIDEGERRVIWKESDLSPVEQRALAILNDAQRVAKKNFLEQDATKLADAVKADWFSPRGKQGRPAGSKIKLARRTIEDKPKLTSVAEVIETILPTIEQLAGPKASSSPSSTKIKAVVSAVLSSADLECTPELAASVVRRLRRTSRSSTI
jgi:hypothetical protein